MRDPKERLKDILDAIARIERYVTQGREAFEVTRDLPILKQQIEGLVKRLEGQGYGG